MKKTAFNPNDATLADLEGGWQFVPRFAAGKSFILTDGGIYVRGPYGSETFRRIASSHHFLELGLQQAPEAVKIAFNYWRGSYSHLANNLMDIQEFFHIKKVTIGGYLASSKVAFKQDDVVTVNWDVVRQEIPAHGGPKWYKDLRHALSRGWGALKIWEIHGDEAQVISNHPLGMADGIIPIPLRALRMAKTKGAAMNRTAVAKELVAVAKMLAAEKESASLRKQDSWRKVQCVNCGKNFSAEYSVPVGQFTGDDDMGDCCPQCARELSKRGKTAAGMKYRDYTIEKSGGNYYVKDPSGHRAFGEVPASIETAKKWIDMDIREKGGK